MTTTDQPNSGENIARKIRDKKLSKAMRDLLKEFSQKPAKNFEEAVRQYERFDRERIAASLSATALDIATTDVTVPYPPAPPIAGSPCANLWYQMWMAYQQALYATMQEAMLQAQADAAGVNADNATALYLQTLTQFQNCMGGGGPV